MKVERKARKGAERKTGRENVEERGRKGKGRGRRAKEAEGYQKEGKGREGAKLVYSHRFSDHTDLSTRTRWSILKYKWKATRTCFSALVNVKVKEEALSLFLMNPSCCAGPLTAEVCSSLAVQLLLDVRRHVGRLGGIKSPF